jgi:hypothetical protein
MTPNKLTVDELCRFLHTIPGDAVVHIVERRTDDREYVSVRYDSDGEAGYRIVRFE